MLKINDKRLAGLALVVCLALISSHSFAAGATASVFRFQQKMADKGMPQAQYKLAMMYETGAGVEKNLIQAKLWYGRAAYQDYKPAQHRLTYLDIRQKGFKDQHQAWLQDLKKDAANGDGEAALLLGQMYADGIGLSRNLKKSIGLLRKAYAGNVPGSETELLRVESIHVAEQARKQEMQRQKAADREHAEQLRKQRLQEQRQKRLEQERDARERQLIAERQRQQRLLRIRQQQLEERKKQAAYQRALQAAMDTTVLISESDSSNICSGRNRFSATCR